MLQDTKVHLDACRCRKLLNFRIWPGEDGRAWDLSVRACHRALHAVKHLAACNKERVYCMLNRTIANMIGQGSGLHDAVENCQGLLGC